MMGMHTTCMGNDVVDKAQQQGFVLGSTVHGTK